jgi:glycine cleavage system H protein
MIPRGELKCVWMEAGVVDFKLCDLQLQCEQCTFDAMIRRQLQNDARPRPSALPSSRMPDRRSVMDVFDRTLSALLQPLRNPQLPPWLKYMESHIWVKEESEETVLCGINHLLVHFLGPVCGVAYPNLFTETRRHSPCAWVVHELGTVTLKSPCAGILSAVNDSLRRSPSLLTNSPYFEGWMVRLRNDGIRDIDKLLSANQAERLYCRQADELYAACHQAMRRRHPAIGVTLYDGGQVIESIDGMIGPSLYFEAVSHALLLS